MSTLGAGKKIPLALQIQDISDGPYFVKCRLIKPDNSELGVSPVTLTDLGNGLFTNYSVTMPNEQFILAQYIVYEDAGFTTQSEEIDSPIVETFELAAESTIIKGQSADRIITRVRDNSVRVKIKDNC